MSAPPPDRDDPPLASYETEPVAQGLERVKSGGADGRVNGAATTATPADTESSQLIADVQALRLSSLTSVAAREVPPKVPLVKDLLYPGAWLFTGRPKIGKSWALLQLALGVAEGTTFLGYSIAARDLEVLAIFGEDDDARIKSRLATLGVARPPSNVHVVNRETLIELAKRFSGGLTFIEFLEQWLIAHPKVRLVLVDTEMLVRQLWAIESEGPRVIENDYRQTRSYDELALRRQLVIILVNHAAKRRGGEWSDIHELINRSNTAFAGASGSIALADPPDADPFDTKSKTRVLGIRGRDLADDILLAVHQEKDMPYFVSDGEYAEVRQTQVEAQLLEALEDLQQEIEAGQYVTAEDLAAATGKTRETVKRSISRMISKGRTLWKKRRVVAKRGRGGGLRLESNLS